MRTFNVLMQGMVSVEAANREEAIEGARKLVISEKARFIEFVAEVEA